MQLETHVSWPLPAAELKPALELALALTRADRRCCCFMTIRLELSCLPLPTE